MKAQICILKLEDWKFKNQKGEELSGQSAVYLLDELELHRTSVKDEIFNTIKKAQLPAIFEADIKATQKYNDGKAKLKYEINSLKFVKQSQIF